MVSSDRLTIVAYIVNRDKVLFVDHKKIGKWLPIAGRIELNENPEEALFREIEEETGLTVNEIKILSSKPSVSSEKQKFLFTPNLLDIHQVNKNKYHIGIIYFVKSSTDKVKLAAKEHRNIIWLKRKDLIDSKYHLRPDLIYSAEQAMEASRS